MRGPMRVAWRWLATAGLLVLAGSNGCGSGGGDEPQPAGPELRLRLIERSGRVELPSARQLPDFVEVATSAGRGEAAGADWSFTVAAVDGGPQLALALSPAGQPMLAGWIGDDLEVISPRTTAEVLLFFRLGMHLLPGDVKVRAVELLGDMTELDAAAEAVAVAVLADPSGLADGDEAVSAALEQVA